MKLIQLYIVIDSRIYSCMFYLFDYSFIPTTLTCRFGYSCRVC